MSNRIFYCESCFVPNARPRITFEEIDGERVCNACAWSIEKKNIDWQKRQDYFAELCKKYGKAIVPWSGGKDSIYVAYKIKEFGIDPLLICVLPHLETEIGKWNRENMCQDFKKLYIELKEEKYRSLARKYFIEQGRPKHPWETAISAAIINESVGLDIPFIVYGEEGEQEYGGVSREASRWMLPVDKEYLMKYYWQNELDWDIPSDEQFSKIFFTQYSRFENWQPFKHADFAIGKGMKTEPVRTKGTFTVSCQLSDDLQGLHAYLMFLKFGFGRCTSDVCIAIREGWTNKYEGLEWIENYDGEFPNELLPKYLDYFGMDKREFDEVLAKHANRELMEQAASCGTSAGHIWYLKSWICKLRRKGTQQEFASPERFDVK